MQARSPTQYWCVLAIAAALSLLAGVIVLAAPKSSLETIALILGIYLLLGGFIQLWAALALRRAGAAAALIRR